MKLGHVLAVALVVVAPIFGAGCSGNDGEIEVDAAGTALTAEGNDALFTLRLVGARDGGYALAALKVKVTPADKDAIDVSCTPNDTNGDGKLGEGESLVCREGATNILDPSIAGTEAIKVEMFATIDGKEETIGDAEWTPAK